MIDPVTGIAVDSLAHLRLELLRLVHRHDKDEQTIIDRAARLESYVIGTSKPAAQAARVRQGKAAPD